MIEVTRHNRVMHVALNRPEKRNALSSALCGQLTAAFDEAEADSAIGAILLSGNGSAFCAGMDLRELEPAHHERLFTTIDRIRKPIVAAVHGAALAGGTGLVANAHVVVAHPEARFGLTEIRLGLWPVLIFRACALAMGERRATELALTGRIFGAAEALEYGLATEIHAEPLQRAGEIAATVSDFSATAIAEGLDYVHRIRGQDWAQAGREGQAVRDRLMQTEAFKKGVQSFLARRD